MSTSTASTIDQTLDTLSESKERWARLPLVDKIAYLDTIRVNTLAVARAWVEAAVAAKGLSMDHPLAGEEWMGGPFSLLWLIRDLRTTLIRLSTGVPALEGLERRALPDGTVSVDVMPVMFDESILFAGIKAEVWMDDSVTLGTLDESVAGFYRQPDPAGAVTVVLGAGNVASIAPMDVVHALFNEGHVALLKLNPIVDYLGPFMERIFADLADDGFVGFAYGGTDVGAALTTHPKTDAVHVTGSAATYDAIVFGTGPDAAARKQADDPVNTRPVSAELGGVTATVVVGGSWTRADLRFQAEHVVSQKMHNSGFNCVGTQVLVLPHEWDQADAFVEEIRTIMAEIDDRTPYYPGATQRLETAVANSGSVDRFGTDGQRLLADDVDGSARDWWTTNELFGPGLAVTYLPGATTEEYLRNAVSFCNTELQGTLGVHLTIDPKTQKRHADLVEKAIADLDYGTVCVNVWSGVAYFLSRCAWGAAPGNERSDIGSGTGFVHNALMFDRPKKSVVRGAFAPSPRTFLKGDPHIGPKMVYFVTHSQAHVVGEKLIDYLARPSTIKLGSIALSAMRG